MSKRLLIMAAFLVGPACASRAPTHFAKSMRALSQANYTLAYREILKAREADPDSAMIQKRTEEVRVLYTLDRARKLIQIDRELEGIERLRALLETYPDNRDAQIWLRKGIAKLARHVGRAADEALASGLIAKAQQLYAQVLLLVPGQPEAISGLARAEDRIQRKLDKADSVYHEAVDAKHSLEWDRVLYLTKICRDYDPDRRDAASLERAASEKMANKLRKSGDVLKKAGRWGAAAKTYRLAAGFAKDARLDWAEEMQPVIDALMKEVKAEQLFTRAELLIKAGRIEKADALIEEAAPLCKHDLPKLTAIRILSSRAKINRIVRRARRAQFDHRSEEAIKLYKQLLGGPSGSFAKDKIEQIREGLAELELRYQEARKALAEGRKVEGRKILREIRAFNPRFRDVEQLLADQSP